MGWSAAAAVIFVACPSRIDTVPRAVGGASWPLNFRLVEPADPRAVTALNAHLAYMRALTIAGNGQVIDGNGVVIFTSPTPLPFLVNAAARTDPTAPAGTVVEAALGHFGDRGFEMLCLEGRDDDLWEAAERAGLHVGSSDPLQYVDRPVDASSARSGVEIRAVTDAAAVGDVIRVNEDAVAAYGSAFPPGTFASIFGVPATVLSPDIYAVVAYEDGRPVATAQIFSHEDVGYVGWVAVVRQAMRRGLGRLVTADVVNQSFERGARAAVLMASPMGAPLYRNMGFIDVGGLRNAYSQPT